MRTAFEISTNNEEIFSSLSAKKLGIVCVALSLFSLLAFNFRFSHLDENGKKGIQTRICNEALIEFIALNIMKEKCLLPF
jgi:hypothetical protein